MALLDRDYMRETPRTHVGETQRRDLGWLNGPPPAQQRNHLGVLVVAILLLAAVIVGVLLASGVVTFAN